MPESDVALVKQGQPVRFQVSAFPEETFSGSIRYIGPAVRAASRDLVVEAVVDNQGLRLRPGMFATARVALAPEQVPVVPATAVVRDGPRRRLYVVTDGRLEERLVQLGEEQGGQVAVLDGVRPGERVVAPVPAGARDGARVM